jgi:hypothetical protein
MKFTQTHKIAASVISGLVILGGGIYAKNQYDKAEAEKAAKLAYENRPIIAESCTMNGYGQGECNFTNTGKSAGAKCGVIAVQGPGVVQSDKFCSGQVAPMSTEKVEFKIPAVDELCDNGFESWTEKCSFGFLEDGLGGGAASEV